MKLEMWVVPAEGIMEVVLVAPAEVAEWHLIQMCLPWEDLLVSVEGVEATPEYQIIFILEIIFM